MLAGMPNAAIAAPFSSRVCRPSGVLTRSHRSSATVPTRADGLSPAWRSMRVNRVGSVFVSTPCAASQAPPRWPAKIASNSRRCSALAASSM